MKSEYTQYTKVDTYYLEFCFIPMLIRLVEEKNVSPKVLVDLQCWQSLLKIIRKEANGFNLLELKCSVTKLSEHDVMILYIFPTPQIPPEAKYGAILADLKKGKYDYLTMELSVENKWFLCGKDGDIHVNFGKLSHELGLEEFGQKVINMFYEKK